MRYIWAQMNAHVTHGILGHREAREIQEKYFFELEKADSVSRIYELCRSLAIEFTNAVCLKKQESSYSKIIQRCCAYVKNNVYEKLTVSSVAAALHFSKGYLSHRFKTETDVTLDDYIRKEKIAEAKKHW